MTKQFIPTFFSKPKLLFIVMVSMASLFSVTILSLFLFLSFSSASRPQHRHFSPPFFDSSSSSPSIAKACKSTRYPAVCEASLTQFPRPPAQPTPLDLLLSLISVSTDGLKTAQSMVQGILAGSSGNQNRSNAAKSCIEVLTNSQRRIASSVDALPRGKTKDARAWMSAALAYQYDCWSGLKYVNGTQKVNSTMSFLNSLIGLSSNALSMMMSYDLFGNEIDSWAPPKTERDGFWEGSGAGNGAKLGLKRGVPSGLKADVTVCGGGCDYKAVQDAVDAAPSNLPGNKRFVIYIKEGVYEETVRVPFEKTNVVFLGDGMGKTVITGSLYSGMPGVTTYTCATVGVLGDGFMASGLTIQNTAGPDAHQAVAFRSDSDLSVLENVEFLGNQDTLYAHSLRQFYKSCFIQGNVDFIFGNSAGYFQDCTILVRPRQLKPEKGENNAVTAHGRIDPAQSTGFVFQNCIINGTEEYMKLYNSMPKVHKNFLGRPWKEFSRTVFLNSNLEALITPQGWMPWSGDFALSTLFYGEAGNSGPGSDVSQRVNWSSKIPEEHLSAYSVQSFIQGDEWIPTSS